ncbi:MAG: hypothetical protein IJ217_03710 [Clostridia bacterium]|nr:hypothetical protein [Clostridia bacterium]
MNMMIESESLKKYISSLLNKSADELTVEDLNKIDYISLKKMNALYQETDCITGDLIQFKNLKGCTLFKFDVSESDIKNLNRIPKLESICFDFCELNGLNLSINESINRFYFNMCNDLKLKQFKEFTAESLTIIGDENRKTELNINDIERMDNLKRLSINNYEIKNIGMIMDVAPNIEYINIDGSTVDSTELNEIKGKIEISNNERFLLVP